MITTNGQLYQWDCGRIIEVFPITNYKVDEIHVFNGTTEYALVLETWIKGNRTYAKIPDKLLQSNNNLDIYAVMIDEHGNGKHTKDHINVTVLRRKKPEDYVYTEDEQRTWEKLQKQLEDLEKKFDSGGADGKSAYEVALDNGFVGTEEEWLESLKGKNGKDGKDGKDGEDGHTPEKGVDYLTPSEKNEIVNGVFNVLKEMDAFNDVSFISDTKVILKPGRMYVFESTGDSHKVQLHDQDGNVQSQIEQSVSGIILYPSRGMAKYIGIKEKPSSIGLSDLLNFNGLFDKFIQTTTFNVNIEKPDIYIETVDNHDLYCWEIAGNSCNLQIGTYATKELIKGITAELSVSFLYPLEFDEYAVAIDGVEIERQSYGGTIRIATELLKAKDTQIVFYRNDEEVIRASVKPTILNCGMLYAIER